MSEPTDKEVLELMLKRAGIEYEHVIVNKSQPIYDGFKVEASYSGFASLLCFHDDGRLAKIEVGDS